MEMAPIIPATDPRWGEAELPMLPSPQRQAAIAAAGVDELLQQQGAVQQQGAAEQRSSSGHRSVDDHP